MGSLLNVIAGGVNPYAGAEAAQNLQQQRAATAQTQAQTPLIQAETEKQQTENQIQQQNLRDMSLIRSSLARNGGDFGKMLSDPDVLQNVNPMNLQGIAKTHADIGKLAADTQSALATAQKTGADTTDIENNYIGGVAKAVRETGYSPVVANTEIDRAELLNPAWKPHLEALRQEIPPNATPDQVKPIFDQIYTQSGQEAKDAAAQAENAKNVAQGTQAQTESEHQQLINNLMKQAGTNPQAGVTAIKTALPDGTDDKVQAGLIAAYNGYMAAGKPDEAAGVIKTASEHMASLSPVVMQNKAKQAGMNAVAEAPTRLATSLAEARALRMGDNPAVAGVAPAAVTQVQNQAMKLDSDYVNAKNAADTIKNLLDLTGAGNKAAAANVPLVGVGALNAVNGIRRMNSAEIAQYGTAGSLMDKIQGKLQGWKTGDPIPADVLQDMQAVHQMLSQQAYRKYTDGINVLNQRTGSKYAPAFGAPAASKAPAAPMRPMTGRQKSTGNPVYSLDGGKTWLPGQPPQQ